MNDNQNDKKKDDLVFVRGTAFANELLKHQKESIDLLTSFPSISKALQEARIKIALASYNITLDEKAILNISQNLCSINDLYRNIGRNLAAAAISIKLSSHFRFEVPEYLKNINIEALAVGSSTRDLLISINNLSKTYENDNYVIPDIEGYITRPQVEVASHNHTLNTLGFTDYKEPDELTKELDSSLSEISNNTENAIEKVNSDWLPVLKGAEKSLLSGNPDKIRHTCTSLRELLAIILHKLGPDDEIRKIYTDPNFYHNGNPTRKTRLKYILTKRYNSDKMSDFIDKNISATIALIDLLHEGAHTIPNNISEEEVIFLFKRVKLTILDLIN